MKRSFFLVLLVVAVTLVPAAAQVPAGGEFRVNTITTGDQFDSAVAALPDGGFVLAWPDAAGIHGQRLDAGGLPRGSQFDVSTGSGGQPAVACDEKGRFVVGWSATAGYVDEIRARRYDAAGAAQGAEFEVSTSTLGPKLRPAVAMARGGDFVVAWEQLDGSDVGIAARRFSASGQALGVEFAVNTFTTGVQYRPSIAMNERGGFVVVWTSWLSEVNTLPRRPAGQRFTADGSRVGGEFTVSELTSVLQYSARVLPAPGGEFTVVWDARDYQISPVALSSRHFDAAGAPTGPTSHLYDSSGSYMIRAAADAAGNFAVLWGNGATQGLRSETAGVPRGSAFQVGSYPGTHGATPSVASDASGNLLATWTAQHPGASDADVYAQRYGGLLPSGLVVDDGANQVLEAGDSFTLLTSWRNVNGAAQTFQGHSSDILSPPGLTVSLSADTDYGTVANGATGACSTCFSGTLSGTRPSGHLDARFLERIAPDALGQVKRWSLHVGESFGDVPRAGAFYRFVETLLHNGVTAGCTAATYCPVAAVTREQMAPFVLSAKEGGAYQPPACGTPMFGDVPASSPFCRWIEELARRGVVSGCAPGLYCPSDTVTREQMAVFVLRTLDPALDPPACTTPVFADVLASSPFCRWIEELARRGVVTGCGGGNYCPTAPVTREQMAVFLTGTFGLTLYGP